MPQQDVSDRFNAQVNLLPIQRKDAKARDWLPTSFHQTQDRCRTIRPRNCLPSPSLRLCVFAFSEFAGINGLGREDATRLRPPKPLDQKRAGSNAGNHSLCVLRVSDRPKIETAGGGNYSARCEAFASLRQLKAVQVSRVTEIEPASGEGGQRPRQAIGEHRIGEWLKALGCGGSQNELPLRVQDEELIVD